MPMILTTRLENNTPIPGLSVSFRKIVKQVLEATGESWHRELFPKHFTHGNRARYKHEKRTRVYLQEIKPEQGSGTGRFVDNVLKGKTRRFTMALATVKGTSRSVRVRMKAPRHVTRPFIGTYRKRDGTLGRITRQPDKAAELTAHDGRDREELSKIAAKHLERIIRENTKPTTTVISG